MAQANAKKQAKAEADARAESAVARAVDDHHPHYHGTYRVYGSHAAAANTNRAVNAVTDANRRLTAGDAHAAGENLRSANADAAATKRAAAKAAEQLNVEVVGDFKNQRDFVVGALEKSLPNDRTNTK